MFPDHYSGFSNLAAKIWTTPGTSVKDGLDEAVRVLNAKLDQWNAQN